MLVYRAIAGSLLAAGALLASTAAAQQNLEYPVKANFLVRFAAFTDWPDQAFSSATSPITLCVVGRDPFGAALDNAARGQSAHGRPFVLRRLETVDRGCHIAYFGRAPTDLDRIAGAPVLTVTDQAVTSNRGMIHFVTSQSRVRFHADQANANRHGVSISSRLLSLALSVRSRP